MDWIFKWYQVDNVSESFYRNNIRSVFRPVLLSLLETPFSQQDLYGPLKHVYNRKTYYWEQNPTLYIINYCSDIIDSHSYDDPRVYTYCYGKHHTLFDTEISKKQKGQSDRGPRVLEYGNSMCSIPDMHSNQEEYKYSQSIYRDLKQAYDCDEEYVSSESRRRSYRLRTRKEKQVISNQEPLKHTHPIEYFIIKSKDGECQMKAKFHTPDPLDYLDSVCSNPNPLKRAYSAQAMLMREVKLGCLRCICFSNKLKKSFCWLSLSRAEVVKKY